MDAVRFLFTFSCFMAVFGAIVALLFLVPNYFDRIVVILLRRLGLGPALYPTAVGIAVLIVTHPEQWTFDRVRLTHPDIGAIWIANAAYGLHLETAIGQWQPNFIERRIIREAVDWRIGRYIRDRLEVALRKNALGSDAASVTDYRH